MFGKKSKRQLKREVEELSKKLNEAAEENRKLQETFGTTIEDKLEKNYFILKYARDRNLTFKTVKDFIDGTELYEFCIEFYTKSFYESLYKFVPVDYEAYELFMQLLDFCHDYDFEPEDTFLLLEAISGWYNSGMPKYFMCQEAIVIKVVNNKLKFLKIEEPM